MRHFEPRLMHRHDFLRVGGLTALGLGWTDLLRLRGAANESGERSSPATSCILIWLDGGPSHLDAFDPKPEAAVEIRGPFATIPTAIPGIRVSELLPRTAGILDQVSLIRSVTSPLGEHNFGTHYLLSGYRPTPALEYPALGAVVAESNRVMSDLPPYIAVPHHRVGGGKFKAEGFLSDRVAPFEVGGDPGKADFRVENLDPFVNVTPARLARRRAFLERLDAIDRSLQSRPPGRGGAVFEQAYRLMVSREAREAFELSGEDRATRARYGPKTIGQSCLLARRLVERGVPFVTVNHTGWDTHNNMVTRLRDGYVGARDPVGLLPSLDAAFAALVEDLRERGLLEQTLVVVMGEFGRTPKLNPAGGRDHWPRVFSVVMAGGGTPGGLILGSSDSMGESPRERPVTPADLAATIVTLMGIDPRATLVTADNRPVPVSQDGKVIGELVG